MNQSWAERERQPVGLSISPRLESRADRLRKSLFGEVGPEERAHSSCETERKGRVARRRMGIDITWVTERVGVGGGIWTAENMAVIARSGITHIIDMQIEFDDTALAVPHGIAVCWNPIDDDFEPKPPEVLARGVEFGLAALQDNEAKLFVHCAAGVHRAPMMTLALLGVMGWTLDDAMELIETRRPVADFADVYVQSVERYLQGRS